MSLIAAAGPMFLAVNGPNDQTSITNMPESGLVVLSVCAIILACGLLLPPILAGRAPRRKGPASTPPWTGPVQGGVHLGDGRSVAPHRDAPAEGFDEETIRRGQAAQATIIRDDDDEEEAGEEGSGAEGSASKE
ncbi:MAG: hypothetical protein JO016_06150 [Actinobacteria bacterium]|jgi:hypothetical protein|nr:hypothetical protein [Actinomycetota bacterium]